MRKFHKEKGKKSPWMQSKTSSNLWIYEKWTICSIFSITVFHPCNSNLCHVLESVFPEYTMFYVPMFLSIIKPPPALRSQVWKNLYYHSNHPFSFICKRMKASSASSHSNKGSFKVTWGQKELLSLMLFGFKHCLYLKSLLVLSAYLSPLS